MRYYKCCVVANTLYLPIKHNCYTVSSLPMDYPAGILQQTCTCKKHLNHASNDAINFKELMPVGLNIPDMFTWLQVSRCGQFGPDTRRQQYRDADSSQYT